MAKQGWAFSQHSTTLVDDKFTTATFEKVNRTTPIADLRWSISHVPRIDLETINMILDSGIHAGGGSDAANVTSY